MKKRFYTLIIISITILINACSKGDSGGGGTQPPVDACAGTAFKFASEVQPIINTSCANSVNCHAAGSVNAGGALTDYNKVYAKRSEIKFQVEAGLMPKGGVLTADQKKKIICWVTSGAPNN